MEILGISCFYHDSAACLVRDGEIVAAAQEELFTRKKHDDGFPRHAIEWCLATGKITSKDLDYIVFYDKPIIKFERLTETYLAYAPSGLRQFSKVIPIWLKQKLWISDLIRKNLDGKAKILFTRHHQAHAASAFYPSPFQDAAILTFDGVGEWETASFGIGSGNDVNLNCFLRYPHSLGLLYSAFTYYTGFEVNSGEYKLMGLAPYGEPTFSNTILNNLLDVKEDGSFKLNMKYFGYCNSFKMINARFEKLFASPPREPESPISQKYMDIAASIQAVVEDIIIKMTRHVHSVTKQAKLCLAGGVALNCAANGKILRDGFFKDIWIQPACGDAGGALGAALHIWYKYLGNERKTDGAHDHQKASLLGPEFSDEDIEKFLVKRKVPFKKIAYQDVPAVVSDLIIREGVIGWFQGRHEFGPRALGARSIIGDPRNPQMQSILNLKIKYRESFRPFAPAVLQEHASKWFDLDKESPYMLFVAPVKEEKRLLESGCAQTSREFTKIKQQRSLIPAVTHVDYSARIQTITKVDNPLFYDTIDAFYKKTGCPLVINTSFNVRGEPSVGSPVDAYQCFMRTEMDYLIMGCFLLAKNEQKSILDAANWPTESDEFIKKTIPDRIELMKFSRNACIALVIYGSVLLLYHSKNYVWFYLAGLIIVLSYLFFPKFFRLFYYAAKKISDCIAWLGGLLALLLLFYIVFLPVGLLIRVFGRDLLDRNIEKNKKSYWREEERKEFKPESYERQF